MGDDHRAGAAFPDEPPGAGSPRDPAADALDRLVAALGVCIDGLEEARSRAVELQTHRRAGRTWQDIVAGEKHPLVVELLSEVMASLAAAGGRWRREEAVALHVEGLSINRIAARFGVTRQRISALIKAGAASTPFDP
jgi:hypothetical protein